MYNLRIVSFPYQYGLTEAEVFVLFAFSTMLLVMMFVVLKKFKVLSVVGRFLNRNEKLVHTNYTLGFENIEVSSKLSVKKISAVTKMVLFFFAFTFILTPFSDFLPTLEYSNYYWGGTMNFLLW